MELFKLEIVTPTGVIFDNEVKQVTLPGAEGEFGVLPRHAALVSLLAWDEGQFLRNTAGTALRRITHEQWLRNVAVALGNGPRDKAAVSALTERLAHPSAMVREHVLWALAQLQGTHSAG